MEGAAPGECSRGCLNSSGWETKAPGGSSPALELGTARLQLNHLHITAQPGWEEKKLPVALRSWREKRDFLILFFVMDRKKMRNGKMKIKGGSTQEKDVLPLKSEKPDKIEGTLQA